MPIPDFAHLSDFNEYKKAFKADAAKLKKDQRVDIHVIFKFKYKDKERPAVILGPLAPKLKSELQAKKIIPKKGKCTRIEDGGVEKLKIQGGIPVKQLAALFREVAPPVQELVESADAVDLTGEDDFDPKPAVAGTPVAASPAASAAPTKAKDAVARERADELGARAQTELGLAKAAPIAPKVDNLVKPAKDIDKVGAAAASDQLSDRAQPAYKQGSMAAIDIGKQKAAELQQTIDKLIAEYSDKLKSVNETITRYNSALGDLNGLQKQLKTLPGDHPKAADAPKLLVEVEDEIKKVTQQRSELRQDFISSLQNRLQKVKEEKDPQKRYDLLMAGREQDIGAVYAQIQKVYADTDRRLVVLGRTADTFAFKERPHDEDRVLHADNWSVAVNDAFIKSGLDQKAEFALLTKFKDSVKGKLKELLAQTASKSMDDVIAEFRAYVKAEADPALWTGRMEHNEGFAVSMRELEQVLRDGYTMMEHDPRGEAFAGESDATKQVMVPKGIGAKIGAELSAAAEKRGAGPTPEAKQLEDRWKRVQPNYEKALKTAGKAELEKQAEAYSKAAEPDKLKKAKAALDALEELVAHHLLRPRQELQTRLKDLLRNAKFQKTPEQLKLVSEEQVAEAAIDFKLADEKLKQLAATLS